MLNTVHEQDEVLAVSELLQEQLHWFEEQRAKNRELAFEETIRHYPSVPHAVKARGTKP